MTRASVARHTGPLIVDPTAVAATEARNALLQFDEVRRLVADRIKLGTLALTPADVCGLQAIAVQGIFACAGTLRTIPIDISNTAHKPPPPEEVPALVIEMCDYANSKATEAMHVSAYLMWRLN